MFLHLTPWTPRSGIPAGLMVWALFPRETQLGGASLDIEAEEGTGAPGAPPEGDAGGAGGAPPASGGRSPIRAWNCGERIIIYIYIHTCI